MNKSKKMLRALSLIVVLTILLTAGVYARGFLQQILRQPPNTSIAKEILSASTSTIPALQGIGYSVPVTFNSDALFNGDVLINGKKISLFQEPTNNQQPPADTLSLIETTIAQKLTPINSALSTLNAQLSNPSDPGPTRNIANDLTANALVYGLDTTLKSVPPGTSGYLLQSQGNQTLPTWINPTTLQTASLSFSNITSGTNGDTLAVAGQMLFPNLETGIAHIDSAGVLSSSAINLEGSDVNGKLPIANGGTGASSAANVRTNLGLGSLSIENIDTTALTNYLPLSGGTLTGDLTINSSNLTTNLGNSGAIKLLSGPGQKTGYIQSAWSNILFSNNAKYTGNNWIYDATGYASQIQTEGNTGKIYLNVAPPKTAGDTLSWTQALTIANNGNVGIGTTIPTDTLNIIGDGTAIRVGTNVSNTVAARLFCASSTKNCYVGSYSNNKFVIRTTDKDRVTIDTNGNVGIGTTDPKGALDINGRASAASLKVYSSFGDLVNNAPWYGIGQSDINLYPEQKATQFAGYWGLNFQTRAGRMVIRGDTGNVGIGTVSPQEKLHLLSGNMRISGGSLCLKSTNTACSGNTPGTVYASNTTVQSADVAENYISSQKLEPGDLVMPADSSDQAVIKTIASYQTQVIGIISTNPGVTLNSDAKTDATHPYLYPIALSGRVPVKVSTENGNISVGDLLTTSSTPGVAMKAIKNGAFIGKALQAYSAEGVGKIMIFVSLSSVLPDEVVIASPSGGLDYESLLSRLAELEVQIASLSANK